ncbi:MAG TPA: glycosyltransferase [Dongiaceae bacterium]|nr:glycosyltransferase [Dongiaceae bacterium]
MKLLVFAHTPPPHHGQSYMVQLMLEGFGGDHRRQQPAATGTPHDIQCYHVNAQLSQSLAEIGGFQPSKIFRLLGYCGQAIWCRFRYGVKNFYYVPAPGKRSALYRDWLVMLLCRPFFPRRIFHWHAAGLGEWLAAGDQKKLRPLTHALLNRAALHLVLSEYNRHDADKFAPRATEVVSNGIPDPCPQFERELLPRRQARQRVRTQLASGQTPGAADIRAAGKEPEVINVLFLALCSRDKGVFDAAAGVLRANQTLQAQNQPLRFRLWVAGTFPTAEAKAEFDKILAQPEAADAIQLLGFVSGAAKTRAWQEADLLCFPTYYANENQPVTLLEAMAFGLPLVTTRWRSLPEIVPPGYPHLADIQSPEQVATALLAAAQEDCFTPLRAHFLAHYRLDRHLENLARALHCVETPIAATTPR